MITQRDPEVSLFFHYCTLIFLRYLYFDFDLVFKVPLKLFQV